MISKAFEEIRVGDTSASDWRTVTEDDVRQFAELTWDRHPLHLDPDYARHTRFGRQIAHGALMLAILLGLVELHPRYVECFYGLDQLRFHAPTFFGDRVRVESEVVDVKPRSDGATAIVTCAGSLFNSDETLVLSGRFSFLVAGQASVVNSE